MAVSAALLTALLVFVPDWSVLGNALSHLDVRWALLAWMLLNGDRLLMAYKWSLLLATRGQRLALVDATGLYCNATIWGLALPTTVGVDTLRTVLLKRRGIAVTDALSSIVVERALGFLSALALALVSLVVIESTWPTQGRYRVLLILFAAGLAASAALLIFSFSAGAFDGLERLLPVRWRNTKPARILKQLHQAYCAIGGHSATIIAFLLLTVVEQLIAIPFTWAVARGMALNVSLPALISALPLALLLARLPASFDGIGVFEATFTAVMSYAGMPPTQALAVAVVSRLLNVLAVVPWWLGYSLARACSCRTKIR